MWTQLIKTMKVVTFFPPPGQSNNNTFVLVSRTSPVMLLLVTFLWLFQIINTVFAVSFWNRWRNSPDRYERFDDPKMMLTAVSKNECRIFFSALYFYILFSRNWSTITAIRLKSIMKSLRMDLLLSCIESRPSNVPQRASTASSFSSTGCSVRQLSGWKTDFRTPWVTFEKSRISIVNKKWWRKQF